MKRLFTNALAKLVPLPELSRAKLGLVQTYVSDKYRQDIAYSKLNRLPNGEVKNMLKVPCPVSTPAHQDSQIKIAVFKRLRHRFNISQESVCFKCQKECPVRAVNFAELPKKPKTSNKSALHDLLIYLLALQNMDEMLYSQLRWSAAYKVSSSLLILLQDYQILSKESLLFREVFKQLDNEERNLLQAKGRGRRQSYSDVDEVLSKRKVQLEDSPYE